MADCILDDTKSCSLCKSIKPRSAFYPSKVLRSGLRSRCIECDLIGAAERSRLWYEANKERAVATRAKYAKENADRLLEAHKVWVKKNRSKALEIKRRYRDSHKEKLAESQRKRFAEQPEKRRAVVAKSAAKNRDKSQAKVQKRRALICAATPSFDADFDELVLIEAYALAKLRSKISGGIWEVDHIEPLRNQEVCGLHNAFNVQVVPRSYNRSKGNKRVELHWLQET